MRYAPARLKLTPALLRQRARARGTVVAGMADAVQQFSGSCFCGGVTVSVSGPPMFSSFCHCSICRRLSGAPYTAQSVWRAPAVELTSTAGDLLELRTSKHVVRERCPACASPVRARMTLGKEEAVAVPLSLFEFEPAEGAGAAAPLSATHPFRPERHIHYAGRVVDCRDGLPKFSTSARGEPMDEE
mmetsp:Transcript_2237/g.8109  ORF Transcript_2237/g.8109 Transcript_2237/m.8109 type:complete len:187 (+) Transcript_2237:1-561(+)